MQQIIELNIFPSSEGMYHRHTVPRNTVVYPPLANLWGEGITIPVMYTVDDPLDHVLTIHTIGLRPCRLIDDNVLKYTPLGTVIYRDAAATIYLVSYVIEHG